MYTTFNTLEELCQAIDTDKHWTGAESALRDRYPMRFVLFEDFTDFYAFTGACQNLGVFVQSIEGWLPEGQDDLLLTYSQLADRFEEYVMSLPANDFVIAPFSEVARFYDNERYAEFDSLVKTIRLINATEVAQQGHQRIYVPIIGMQGKMNKFKNDPNMHIWELNSNGDGQRYRLIVSRDGTYGIKGIDEKFTICHNMREWIGLWKSAAGVKHDIICISKAIADNAQHAQPDNAFEYVTCSNAYKMLTDGLGIEFPGIEEKEAEMPFWEQLASSIDVYGFDFCAFVSQRLNAYTLDSEKDFVHAWFECHDDYSRWLLKIYYLQKNGSSTYLGRTLMGLSSLSTPELFSQLATLIFEEPFNEQSLRQRLVLLKEAGYHQVQITDMAEQKVKAKLKAIAIDPERGYYHAMKYMTPLTQSEKTLMTEWLGGEKIDAESVRTMFASLYHYMMPLRLNLDEQNQWVNTYFDVYRKAKLANQSLPQLMEKVKEKNASATTFSMWRDNFKTVKTILHSRDDIDIYYWVDGLGVDWLPYIASIIEKHKVDGVYLNEMYVATADLPTRTANNKQKLLELSQGELKKIGDLDTYAHSQKSYPDYIIHELSIVEEAVSSVLSQYNGKKIAFVSDHGISYMPQLGIGLDLGFIDSDHAGRCGEWQKGNAPADSNYVVADDGKTVCSLTYNSLGTKTPTGQGAHGGATPEEVLVPIIIVSPQKNASVYSATLIDKHVKSNNPVVAYQIKGMSSIDQPMVRYNGVDYAMHKVSGNTYESEKLNLVATTSRVTLVINEFEQTDIISVKTGVEEEDLFGGL